MTNSFIRDEKVVMDPARLGAMHQTRLSFARCIIRKMAEEKWQVLQTKWDLDQNGYGCAIYQLSTNKSIYNLVVFSQEIDDDDRDDRVLAERWDVTFVLVKGGVDHDLLVRLQENVPLQEAGRNDPNVLVLARANKSMRIFEHIISALANGHQPDTSVLINVGYILRTTAVYGNGKFGISDFDNLQNDEDFSLSFTAQLCAVYLLRQYSIDLVHYLSKIKAKKNKTKPVALVRELQRYMGVGNATGLGMVPFLIKHPLVIDKWLSQREKAIAYLLSKPIDDQHSNKIIELLKIATKYFLQIVTIDEIQQAKNSKIIDEIPKIIADIRKHKSSSNLWHDIVLENQQYSLEGQEVFISCLLEVYPEIDSYALEMNADRSQKSFVGVSVGDLKAVICKKYDYATKIDFDQPENQSKFWYISANKQEPRIGVRNQDQGESQEQPLDIARQVSKLSQALQKYPDQLKLTAFLLENQSFSAICRRVWTVGDKLMGEIRCNALADDFLPINLLRCKLSMFGATKFDPRSILWVRVTLFQGAPLLDEINSDQWLFPIIDKSLDKQISNKELVSLSLNEIQVYCARAYQASKKLYGEQELIAKMVVELETIGLNGLAIYVDALNSLAKSKGMKNKFILDKDNCLSVDLQGESIIGYLPNYLEYVIDTISKDTIELKLKHTNHQLLMLSELKKFAKLGYSISARWYDKAKDHIILYLVTKDCVDIYITAGCGENDNNLNKSTLAKTTQICLTRGTKLDRSIVPENYLIHIDQNQLSKRKKDSLLSGISVAKSDWDYIQATASKMLIPD